jgi:Xaa-Pro aminopeptidase
MKISFNFAKRKQALKKLLCKNNIEALLILSREHIFYIMGYSQDDAYLLLTPKGDYLITDARYQLETENLKANCKKVITSNPLKDISELIKKHNFKTLGFEEDSLNYQMYASIKKQLPHIKLIAAAGYIKELVLIKDSQEIKAISIACKIVNLTLAEISKIELVEKSEKEISAYLKYHISKLGYETADYEPIVASGVRSALPHAKTTRAKIKNDSNLLIDLGAKVYGYNSDLTRTYSLSKMKAEYKRIYNIVKEAQQKAIESIKPGLKASDIDKAARNTIAAYGYADKFIHTTGHGVGLHIHEGPTIGPKNQQLLKPGMVFTIEPGIYLAHKFGIRIEDVVVVTQKGHKVLSHDIANAI